MSLANRIDLSRLPPVTYVPQLSIDQITQESIDFLRAQDNVVVPVDPADPAYRLIRSLSYRERLLRQQLEEACKQTSLAYAEGDALEHIGITYHRTPRLNNEGIEEYRQRIALAPEGRTVAGSENSYIFHALSASALVKDVSFYSPLENEVVLTVLSTSESGIPDQSLLDQVSSAVNPFDVRAQGDRVTVQAAEVIYYIVNATLTVKKGVDTSLVVNAAKEKAREYADREQRLGGFIDDSGYIAALFREGVKKVELIDFSKIEATKLQAPYNTAINLIVEFSS